MQRTRRVSFEAEDLDLLFVGLSHPDFVDGRHVADVIGTGGELEGGGGEVGGLGVDDVAGQAQVVAQYGVGDEAAGIDGVANDRQCVEAGGLGAGESLGGGQQVLEAFDVENAGAAQGTLKPVSRVFDCRMVGFYPTTTEPMRGLVDRMSAAEKRPGMLSVSFAHGFPWGDTPETGSNRWVVPSTGAWNVES